MKTTTFKIAFIKKSDNKYCQEYGKRGTLIQGQLECKLVQLLWKSVAKVLKIMKRELPYDPARSLLGIYTKVPILYHMNTWTSMYCCQEKKLKCSSAERQMDNERMYTYTVQIYSRIKKNEINAFIGLWTHLKSIILSKVTQTSKCRKIKKHVIHIMMCTVCMCEYG